LGIWVIDRIITELFAVDKCFKTSINNAHIKWKNSKTTNTPETISSAALPFSKRSASNMNSNGPYVMCHYDVVIGVCPLAGFKTVKVKPGKCSKQLTKHPFK
jgi:hypothetical protein